MTRATKTKFDEELGKALADRMGLCHETTLQDYTTESLESGVVVKMQTFRFMSREDYEGLRAVAKTRSEAK